MKIRLLLLIILLLPSCFFMGPKDNTFFFDKIDRLNKLDGVYQNLGEGRQDLPRPVFLSKLIWPTDEVLDHSLIKTIVVRAISDKTLNVKAFHKEILIKEAEFTEGKDFEISFGRILLKQRINFLADVFLGPYYERAELGIDSRGDGKNRQYGVLAGLGFLIIPVAGGGRDDIRFVRIGN